MVQLQRMFCSHSGWCRNNGWCNYNGWCRYNIWSTILANPRKAISLLKYHHTASTTAQPGLPRCWPLFLTAKQGNYDRYAGEIGQKSPKLITINCCHLTYTNLTNTAVIPHFIIIFWPPWRSKWRNLLWDLTKILVHRDFAPLRNIRPIRNKHLFPIIKWLEII